MSSRIELSLPHAEDFLKQGLYLRGWSKTTLRTYRQGLNSLSQSVNASFQQSLRESGSSNPGPILDGPSVNSLTKAQLENWIISLKERGLTNGGINMYIRTINSFLTYLSEQTPSFVDKNLRLKLLPNPSKPIRGFSDNEIRSLLSFRPRGFTELRTWTLISCLLDTGCRIDEILNTTVKDCDLDAMFLTVHGKGSKIRHVPFSLEFRKNIFRYLKSNNFNHFIFCTRNGSRLSYRNTYRDIKNLCAKAGVVGSHVHPHALRHHFAVTYIRRGGDIYRLSRILGHSNISTTTIYLRSMGIEQLGENHSKLSPLTLP